MNIREIEESLQKSFGYLEGDEPDFTKFDDEIQLRDEVLIFWDVEGIRFVDRGFIFTLPNYDEDIILSGVVQIPKPWSDPMGKMNEPTTWATVYDLCTNEYVVSIKKYGSESESYASDWGFK